MCHGCPQDSIVESACGIALCLQAFHVTSTGAVKAAEDAGFNAHQ
jgi:hypothetical protein